MKVLITGVSGFIGSHLLTAVCNACGSENVVALSSRMNAQCETILYSSTNFGVDPLDLAKLDQVEVLIHAGAYTPKSAVDANAIDGCGSNISFTEMLLHLPLRALRKIVYLSTLDVYEPAERITESTPTLPLSLYGMSKLYCEHLISAFVAMKEGVVCQVLRIGHVYGPGEEKYSKFMPKAIANIVDGKAVELWGDGAEKRSFIYVDDVVESILAAVTLPTEVGVINVVSGHAISIRQLLDELIAISGKKVELDVKERNGAPRDYEFDNAKLRTYLLPQETDLITGLRREYQYVADSR